MDNEHVIGRLVKIGLTFLYLLIGVPSLSVLAQPQRQTDAHTQPKDNTGWARFNDPTLDSLISLGLTSSPNLKAALSRVEEARIRAQVAQSFLSPSVRSSAILSTQSLSEHRPVAVPVTADRLPRFQLNTFQVLPVDVSYELDLFRRIRNSVTVANLQAQATEADYRAFRLVLAAEIARFYWLVRANDAEQRVFRQNLVARDSTVSIIKERFRVGLINQIDVQRAETDVAQLRVQIISLQRARTELVNGLAQLCAQNPAFFSIATGNLPPALPIFPYAGISPDLLRRRPDLEQLERLTQAAETQVAVTQAARMPRVTVGGSGGLLSGQIGPWFTAGSATYSVGVNASVPLFEGGRNRQNITLAGQQVETARQTHQQQIQIAQREAETALDNLTILRQQIDAQSQTVSLARRTEQYNRELYVRGLTTYLEVLDAQRTILIAEQSLVQLRGQEASYWVALLRALGGDY